MRLEDNQCSLDIETLGTKPGCAVVSIGAVAFSKDRVLPARFYRVLDIKSQLKLDLRINPETLAWWMDQDPAVQLTLKDALSMAGQIGEALDEFSLWYRKQCFNAVWARGASFDFAILTTAAQRAGRELPWKFWQERCQRTVTAMYPEVQVPRSGTYHNALDDAITQAQHLVDIHRYSHDNPQTGVPADGLGSGQRDEIRTDSEGERGAA